METQVLRWFQEVADGRTVTEVSESYTITQPAVSRALARLERELGTPLLRKEGRVLRPTRAGSAFKRHADAAMHALDDGIAAVSELLDPESGTVALAFQPSLGAWLVPELIASFRRRHPGVSFELIRSDGTLGSSPIARGDVDLELTSRHTRNPAVQWSHLFTEPLLLAVPPGHALVGRPETWLTEVADDPFIALEDGRTLRAQTNELCEQAGIDPTIAFVADDLTTARGLVAAGLGVAIVPAMGAEPGRTASDGVTLVPVADQGAGRSVRLVWPLERRLLPSADRFRRFVLNEWQGSPEGSLWPRRPRPPTHPAWLIFGCGRARAPRARGRGA